MQVDDAQAASKFDPYAEWFNIPPEHRPPNMYELLGVRMFESDKEKIRSASLDRMIILRRYQSGSHSQLSQEIMNEISTAVLCLCNPDAKRRYDQSLAKVIGVTPGINKKLVIAVGIGVALVVMTTLLISLIPSGNKQIALNQPALNSANPALVGDKKVSKPTSLEPVKQGEQGKELPANVTSKQETPKPQVVPAKTTQPSNSPATTKANAPGNSKQNDSVKNPPAVLPPSDAKKTNDLKVSPPVVTKDQPKLDNLVKDAIGNTKTAEPKADPKSKNETQPVKNDEPNSNKSDPTQIVKKMSSGVVQQWLSTGIVDKGKFKNNGNARELERFANMFKLKAAQAALGETIRVEGEGYVLTESNRVTDAGFQVMVFPFETSKTRTVRLDVSEPGKFLICWIDSVERLKKSDDPRLRRKEPERLLTSKPFRLTAGRHYLVIGVDLAVIDNPVFRFIDEDDEPVTDLEFVASPSKK